MRLQARLPLVDLAVFNSSFMRKHSSASSNGRNKLAWLSSPGDSRTECAELRHKLPGSWFDPGLMDRLKLVLVSFLKSNWTDITKITMTTFAIVKTFDVIKYISLRFVSR